MRWLFVRPRVGPPYPRGLGVGARREAPGHPQPPPTRALGGSACLATRSHEARHFGSQFLSLRAFVPGFEAAAARLAEPPRAPLWGRGCFPLRRCASDTDARPECFNSWRGCASCSDTRPECFFPGGAARPTRTLAPSPSAPRCARRLTCLAALGTSFC